jgi:hypothetical protein
MAIPEASAEVHLYLANLKIPSRSFVFFVVCFQGIFLVRFLGI